MSFRQRGFSRRRQNRLGSVIDSNKNVVSLFTAAATGADTTIQLALTVDAAANTSVTEVTRGCKIFRIWVEMWVGTSATAVIGITNGFDAYILKNPGANLTPPAPGALGSSNEKKFAFKVWKGLTGARTEGTPYYFWKGWIKIPKVYQRMGADDTIDIIFRPTGANIITCINAVYKWFK